MQKRLLRWALRKLIRYQFRQMQRIVNKEIQRRPILDPEDELFMVPYIMTIFDDDRYLIEVNCDTDDTVAVIQFIDTAFAQPPLPDEPAT